MRERIEQCIQEVLLNVESCLSQELTKPIQSHLQGILNGLEMLQHRLENPEGVSVSYSDEYNESRDAKVDEIVTRYGGKVDSEFVCSMIRYSVTLPALAKDDAIQELYGLFVSDQATNQ